MSWTTALERIASLGESTPSPGSLAGCHAARLAHHGQFFTPEAVVGLCWHILGAALVPHPKRAVRVVDTCCGSGRMLGPADPRHHEVWGCDVDADLVAAVAESHRAAGFSGEVIAGRIEERRPAGFDVALINPPFSLAWDNPLLENLDVTHRGRFGAHSAALSHWYCLEQATIAAPVVAAVLPLAAAQALQRGESPVSVALARLLRLTVILPGEVFAAEGAQVATAVVVLCDPDLVVDPAPSLHRLASLERRAFPAPLRFRSIPRAHGAPTLRRGDVDDSEPAITQAPTGDRTVRILRHGRYLTLRTACGGTRARALNRLLVCRLPSQTKGESPRPAGVRYRGQGRFDVQLLLSQPEPMAALEAIAMDLSAIGLAPEVDPALVAWMRRAVRRTAVAATPFRHVVARPGEIADPFAWGAGQRRLRLVLVGPLTCRGASYPAGASIELEHTGGSVMSGAKADPTFRGMIGEAPLSLPLSAWLRLGTLADLPTGGWHEVHPGIKAAFPHLVAAEERRMRALGIDRILTRGYQWDDCAELRAARSGVCAWDMALGKGRLAIALALLGGRANLIVVQARLVEELADEFAKLGIPAQEWQVIDSVAAARSLRRINLISLSRLRQPLGGYQRGTSRMTIARLLRRRLHTVVVDEAHALRNHGSDQTRAVWMLSPRRVYDLSGTPIANYPRDILPLLVHVAGDGTAAQPYGLRRGYLKPELIAGMDRAQRGPAAFAEAFIVTEWVTNQFLEDMQGAKREVPVIADVPRFREMVAPHIKRRVISEPEVAMHVRIPEPTREVVDVEWDQDHLDTYVATVREFADWYRARQDDPAQRNNLAILLRKVGAIVQAVNAPQWLVGPCPYRGGLTSKQRAVVERIAADVAQGHKVLSICHAPAVAELIAEQLEGRGLQVVRFHGGIPIAVRNRAKNGAFRRGDAQVMSATLGCVKEGLNLPEVDREVFYSRDWTSTAEEQAERRLLRPEQKRSVVIARYHLAGSMDDYQDQMVNFKASTIRGGLDYGEPGSGEQDFLHLETILAHFLEDFGARFGYDKHGRRGVA